MIAKSHLMGRERPSEAEILFDLDEISSATTGFIENTYGRHAYGIKLFMKNGVQHHIEMTMKELESLMNSNPPDEGETVRVMQL